ncbi:MAG TPA: hypothetical protein PKY82_10520 [Pyrinomonadaceae bacterium]|nr:hypothetical protein [Pyrinomonadaceae bacterium]
MKIVGTIIVAQKFRPFIFENETEKLILDEYSWERAIPINPFAEMELKERIKKAAEIEVEQVKIGEYFCETCRKWRKATSQEWSYGMCLSCSLDRDSDFSDSLYD